MVTEKLIAAAIDEKKTPKEIADAINASIRVAGEVAKINSAMAAVELEYRKSKIELEKKLRDIKADCPHLARTYHPDPSGNNDSYHECDSCGKTF